MGNTAEAADRATQATLQPGSHHQVLAFAAVCHALDNRRASARTLYGRVLAERPNYGVDEFLRIFPFQVDDDERRIREAFKLLETQPGF
jgi:hypothetical protein